MTLSYPDSQAHKVSTAQMPVLDIWMKHPYERLSRSTYWRFFWILLGATIVLGGILGALGMPLQHLRTGQNGPCDIVAFEVAGTEARANAITAAWRDGGVIHYAKWNTWLDYLFLACYPNFVALGIAGLMRFPMSIAWHRFGRALAWAQWLVLACDGLENAALLRILYGVAQTPWPQMAWGCAVLKFGFLTAGVTYLLVAFFRVRCAGACRRDAVSGLTE